MAGPVRAACERVALSALVAFAIFAALFCGLRALLGVDQPFMVVVGNSMYPTLKDGDLIVVRGVDPSTLAVGDIVVYRSPNDPRTMIVHRIVEVVSREPPAFRTKGDNRAKPDSWLVTGDMIVGQVVAVLPYLGIVPRILQPILRPPANYLAIGLVILAILAWEVFREATQLEQVQTG